MSVENVLRKHRKLLLSTIDEDRVLVETLYAENVFNERKYQEIKAEPVPIQAAEKLLDILMYSGSFGLAKFCCALDDEYKWLAEKIRQDAKEAGINLNASNNSGPYVDSCLSGEVSQMIPEERQLMRCSKILVQNNWKSILYELGLRTSEIEHCQQTNAVESSQCMSGLLLWLRRNGSAATFNVLYKASQNADVDQDCLSNFVKIAKKL